MADKSGVEGRVYPCADCGKMRTKAEGGTVFTVCDACWDKAVARGRGPEKGNQFDTRARAARDVLAGREGAHEDLAGAVGEIGKDWVPAVISEDDAHMLATGQAYPVTAQPLHGDRQQEGFPVWLVPRHVVTDGPGEQAS